MLDDEAVMDVHIRVTFNGTTYGLFINGEEMCCTKHQAVITAILHEICDQGCRKFDPEFKTAIGCTHTSKLVGGK